MLKNGILKNCWLIIVLLFSFICVPVLGDGLAFKGTDYHSLRPVLENEQRAVIVHNNGIEKLLIAVSLELESEEKALWIFPVPGSPDKVKIDVVDSFPKFSGENPHKQVRKLINRAFDIALATQIYAIPFTFIEVHGGLKYAALESITIHNQVDKWGVHAETISADSMDALEKYLQAKEVKIDRQQIKVFENYLSEKYVLVIAWISSRQELLQKFPEYKVEKESSWSDKKRWPCLFVEFPSDRTFYPLRPTSSYGNEYTPIHLTIKGMVKPDYPTGSVKYDYHMVRYTSSQMLFTEYYTQKGLPEDTPDELREDLSNDRMFYTTVNINLKGGELAEDLWLVSCKPKEIIYADKIASLGENKIIFFIFTGFVILLLSYFCAGFAGLILFGKWNGYSQFGLWNIFTLVGVYIGTKIAKGTAGQRLKDSDRFPGRWMFIIVFSILYIVALFYFNSVIEGWIF